MSAIAPQPARRSEVVAGGSSGIGLAVAQAFATHGADVVLAARGESTLAEAATACRAICDADTKVTDRRRGRWPRQVCPPCCRPRAAVDPCEERA